MKGDKMAKRSSFGNMVRRRLSDITNSLPNPKSPGVAEKLPIDSTSGKDYIDNLVKENLGLAKLIQDKNKIIELCGVEIQSLRESLHKMQLQNWNLAQSNSLMLAELNLCKDKLKAMQHELVCKEALLKAKNLELKLDTNDHIMVDVEPETNGANKPENGSRRGHPSRSRSLGYSTSSQQIAEKEAVKTKRRCLRRKSAASYRTQNQEQEEDLFDIEYDSLPVTRQLNSPMDADEACEWRRTSIGRPLRRAVEKIESYKERPINVKMRRAE